VKLQKDLKSTKNAKNHKFNRFYYNLLCAFRDFNSVLGKIDFCYF